MSNTGIAADVLRSIVERVEALNEEIDALNSDKRDIYAEAKGNGFCTKTLKKVVQLRKLDKADRVEQETLLDMYRQALGMLD